MAYLSTGAHTSTSFSSGDVSSSTLFLSPFNKKLLSSNINLNINFQACAFTSRWRDTAVVISESEMMMIGLKINVAPRVLQ